MSNNFTPRAQQALALAKKEAEKLNHNYIGTEHLLIGLINLGQGLAIKVLQEIGVGVEDVYEAIEDGIEPGSSDKSLDGKIPMTPRVKKVLVLAEKESKKWATLMLAQSTFCWA